MITSDAKKALDFMELNVILGTDFDKYSQFYNYAKTQYSMSAKSLLTHFTFVELANLIKLSNKTNNLWVIASINSPVEYRGTQFKTKRKLLYALNLSQKEFLVKFLKYDGDLDKALEPKGDFIVFLNAKYKDYNSLFKEHNSILPNLNDMKVPFRTLEDYVDYLESSYVLINNKPLLSLRQLCFHLRTTSELLVPVFKYYKKYGEYAERQESFNSLLNRFHEAQQAYMKDSNSSNYGSLADFVNTYKRTPQSIIKTVYAPQPFNVVHNSLLLGEGFGIQLNNFNRKIIYKGLENDFELVAKDLFLTAQQLNDILISGFSNSFVEERLIELAWRKGLYDFEVSIVDFDITNPFLDELFKL